MIEFEIIAFGYDFKCHSLCQTIQVNVTRRKLCELLGLINPYILGNHLLSNVEFECLLDITKAGSQTHLTIMIHEAPHEMMCWFFVNCRQQQIRTAIRTVEINIITNRFRSKKLFVSFL